MSAYDFTSLSSYDFEQLVKDLLQNELGVTLESFTSGRDKGIDLRHSPDPGGKLIVQCKHYANSTYAALLNHLKTRELPKVRLLSPSRYVIATSLGLTPQNKDEIKAIFDPFCRSTGDIFGRDDLNGLLRKFPEVERQNFKLWLTSAAVLERVIHSRIFSRTGADVERIKRRLKYYVQNESFFVASAILEREHYCIIAGIPGIGKTTLAEILLIEHIKRGYEPYVISGGIDEAFAVYNPAVPQVFYYDDFLGQTSLEQKLNRDEDRSILRFIEAAGEAKTPRLILTTREYILRQAKATYEALDRSHFDAEKCTIELADYTRFERAKILYNHVYFSQLPEPCKNSLLEGRSYLKVIDHKNYSPRVIEWMTDYTKTVGVDCAHYVSTFIENLDNPSRLWGHAFKRQLSSASRSLLLVTASLPGDAFVEDIEAAFAEFYRRQSRAYGLRSSPTDFNLALDELEGTFVRIEKQESGNVVTLHNASIKDYLQGYLVQHPQEALALLESAVFFDQCVTFWGRYSMWGSRAQDYQEPPLRYVACDHPQEFLRILERTFNSTDCRLRLVQYGHSGTRVKTRNRLPPESRLMIIMDVVEELGIEGAQEVLGKMLRSILENVNRGAGEKGALLWLLRRLRQSGDYYGVPKREIYGTAKRLLLNNPLQIEDFTYISRLKDEFEVTLTQPEFRRAKKAFTATYHEDVRYVLTEESSPEEVRSYAETLEGVAHFFGVEVDQELQELEERASDLATRDDWFDDETPRFNRQPESGSDSSLDALFESLTDAS